MAPSLLRARLGGAGCVHNISIAPETELKTDPVGRLRQRLRMALMCAPVSRFVFLSHQLRRQYQQRWPLRSSQIEVIPNGVDLGRFRPSTGQDERSTLRAAHGLRAADKVVLFVGGIMARKGVDILLEAWNRFRREQPDAVLLVLGSQAGRISHERAGFKAQLADYLCRIDDLRARLDDPASVRFLGEIEDPAPYYRMADAFAFPSRREGLPNAVLEAMASGLPCLVARFDGIPEDGEELGLAGRHHQQLGHDPEAWSAALSQLLHPDQTGHRLAMGRQARAWMEAQHDLAAVLDRWNHLYRETARQL